MKAIHVLRKPLSEPTVVANVLTHGCGGLNIDATRITGEGASPCIARRATAARAGKVPGNPVSPTGWLNRTDLATYTAERAGESIGRWPANLILQHLDGCVQTGVREDSIKRPAPEYNPPVHQGKRASLNGIGCSQGDVWYSTGMATPVYECAHGCPVAALDTQSGVLKSGALPANQYATEHAGSSVFAGAGVWESKAYGSNEGGASRFFKQFGSSS